MMDKPARFFLSHTEAGSYHESGTSYHTSGSVHVLGLKTARQSACGHVKHKQVGNDSPVGMPQATFPEEDALDGDTSYWWRRCGC